MLSIWQNIYFI